MEQHIQEIVVLVIVAAAGAWLIRNYRRRKANPCDGCECCAAPDLKATKPSAKKD